MVLLFVVITLFICFSLLVIVCNYSNHEKVIILGNDVLSWLISLRLIIERITILSQIFSYLPIFIVRKKLVMDSNREFHFVRLFIFLFRMDFAELLSKDLANASLVVRQMTSDEIDQFQATVMKMDSVFRCRFARLLVCRNDSIRLLSLLDQGDLELTHCCIRYLKIRSVRKDLLSRLTSESEFCKLYSGSCDYGRNALLETLVWNKNREENCLADRLLSSGTLQLNAYQNRLLRSACSSSHFLQMQQTDEYSKKYVRQQKTEMDQVAVEHLYYLYQNRNEYMDELTEKCDVYIPFIKDIWRTAEVDGKKFRIFDLILDLWSCQDKSLSYLGRVLRPRTCVLRIGELDNNRNLTKLKSRCSTLFSYICHLFSVATVYCCKRCEFGERVKSSLGDCFMSMDKILFIYQSALIVGDEELINLTIQLLTMEDNMPTYYGFGICSDFTRIKETLTPNHYSMYLDGLQDCVLNKMRCVSPSTDIYWSPYPSTIYVLSKEVTNSPKMEEILSLFFTFEKRYLNSDIATLCSFYGLQNQEVPLDFAYQLAPKTLSAEYPTCRKWESILCLKGNTHLNSREASQRMTVLKSLLKIASASHDVRSFYRCFAVYARTEMKFNDITLDLSDSLSYFSPDTLGLSPLSVSFSGSVEEAEKARSALVSMILEWANFKKGDAMISPLVTIVGNMYYYACIYPEYEDVYTSMMKPLCEFMVKDSMMYDKALLKMASRQSERSSFYIDAYSKENQLSSLFSANGVKNYQAVEAYCAGKKDSLSGVEKVFHCGCSFTCPFPYPNIKSAPIAKKPLLMLLELAQNDNVDMKLLCSLFDAFVNSTIIDREYQTSVREVVSRYEEDKMELVRFTTTVTTSGDRELLSDLYNDTSLSWKYNIKGYTMMMTLHRLYHFGCSDYFSRSSLKRSSLNLVSIPQKKVEKEDKLSTNESLRRHLIHKKPSFIAALIDQNIDSLNEGYSNWLNVKDLNITVDSLTVLLNTSVPVYDVFTLLDIKARSDEIPSLLKVLSNSSLETLQKLASLSVYVSFQSAVTAVSLNKSDKPLMDKTLIEKLPSLHDALMRACFMLVCVNDECQYRGISTSQMFNVFTICPFLVDWLKAVKEYQTQDFFTMKKEDPVELETSPRCSVELDFSQNVVVCRLVEILIYSRSIKEFFGTNVTGFGRMSTMLTTDFALLMCRRYLLVSSFVHIAESIIEGLLLTASNKNEVTSGILSMIADSSSCITVALIGLLFRLGSKPAIQSKGDMMKKVIIKVTNYIIKNDFKSEDVYVYIMKWICRQVLEVENYDKDLVHELLHKLTMLNVTEAAGRTIFSIMGKVATFEVEYSVGYTDVADKALKDIKNWYNQADDRKKKNLISLFLEMIPLFNTKDDESIFIYQAGILVTNKYAGEYPELLNYSRDVLNAVYTPYDNTPTMYKSALCLLMLNKCDDAIELGNHALFVNRQLKQLKLKYEDLTVSSEYKSLGIPENMNGMIKEMRLDYDILDSLYVADDSCLKCLSSLTVGYPDGIVASTFASCLLQSVGEKEFSRKDIDLDKLCDAVEATFKPWMYGFIRGDQYDHFFFSDKEFTERIQSLLERRKTLGSVFLALRYDDCDRNGPRVWVSENDTEELYSYL